MVRQCAVLVGGLGTRLGAIAADTPKPMLTVGDRPFLAWLLREVVRYGIADILLLTGHLSGFVTESLQALRDWLPRPVTVSISEEPMRAGTGGALFHAHEHLQDSFLLLNGDSLFDCDLAPLLARAEEPEVLGRLMLRSVEDALRYGVVETNGGESHGISGTTATWPLRCDQRWSLSLRSPDRGTDVGGMLARA